MQFRGEKMKKIKIFTKMIDFFKIVKIYLWENIMAEFYFIRHGEADYSERDTKFYRNQGSFMCTLTEKGIEQAKQAAKDERFKDAELILTSPYGRAFHTAAILSKELQIDIKVESDVHEWLSDVVNFEYLDNETATKYWHEFDENNGNYPEGETRPYETAEMIRKRVFAVLKKYENYKKVIVVSHGTLMRYCLDVPYVSNCQICKFEGNL